MATLDQVANGRVVLGLGGGWLQQEYDVYGIPYGTPGERLRKLDEYIQCVRGLLTQERTTFEGEFFTLRDAQCEPKPVQERLPIWIGGGGEKVTLRICAEHADGWNVPFIAPDAWAHKAQVLDEHCERRRPRSGDDHQDRSTSAWRSPTRNCERQFGAMANYVKPGVLSGSVQEMVDKVGGVRRRRRVVGDPRDARAVRPRRPRTVRGRGDAGGAGREREESGRRVTHGGRATCTKGLGRREAARSPRSRGTRGPRRTRTFSAFVLSR